MNFEHYLRNYKEVIDKEVEGWFYPKVIIITLVRIFIYKLLYNLINNTFK